MTLYLQMVFILMVVEIVVFVAITLPIPGRAKVVSKVLKSAFFGHVLYILKIVFGFVVILFIDSVNRMMKAQSDVNSDPHEDARMDSMLKSKLFYSQRNMYLCGSTLFLSWILNRYCSLLQENADCAAKLKGLMRQSEHGGNSYEKLLDEYTELKKENENNRQRMEKVKDSEMLKKQADQNYQQYLDLAEKYAKLEKQVDRDGGMGSTRSGFNTASEGGDEYELKSRRSRIDKDD